MLGISVSGDQELVSRFKNLTPEIHAALLRKIHELTIKLEAHVKTVHLSGPTGPDSLSVRSGNLRSGVFQEVTDNGSSITGMVAAPRDVPYAAIHEFGGVINSPGGTPYFIDSKSGQATFVSKESAMADRLPVTAAHIIHMPERSYLRSSLREMRDEILAGLQDAVREVISAP